MQDIGRYKNKSSFKQRRSGLRKNQTTTEGILWSRIRRKQLGVKFRRQYNIDFYIVDFYCHELELVIELDGWVHGEKEVVEKDKMRENYLKSKGYTILRYRNEQIRYELKNVVQDVWNNINQLRATKDPT